MQLPLIDKRILLFLTNAKGKSLDPVALSIQDLRFKKDGQYEITCKAAANEDMEIDTIRHGRYSLKENKNGKITLLCDEESGPFKGQYEVKFDMIKDDLGQFQSKGLKDGSAVNGLFKISA